jgi:hypothetical protein
MPYNEDPYERLIMTKIEEIYANVLPMLEAKGVEDTPLHRLWALEGLRDGWLEDDPPPEAAPWISAIEFEIVLLRVRTVFQRV